MHLQRGATARHRQLGAFILFLFSPFSLCFFLSLSLLGGVLADVTIFFFGFFLFLPSLQTGSKM